MYAAGYVLAEYGTGAVMGVPAHDERDYAMAQAKGLPIIPVIAPPPTLQSLPSAAGEGGNGGIDGGGEVVASAAVGDADDSSAVTAAAAACAEVAYIAKEGTLVQSGRFDGMSGMCMIKATPPVVS